VARIFLERRDKNDDELRRLFDELEGLQDRDNPGAECTMPLDVLETSRGIEVIMDLVGVSADAVQVVIARETLLIMGQKRPGRCEHHGSAAFHVAERVFGRFARVVRLTGAFDVREAVATLRAGELRVTLPRRDERRGREHRITVQAG
jgi:HSP20 family protein